MRKTHIGKLINFHIPYQKVDIIGMVIDYTNVWTFIKRAYDYSFDGFTVFKNENVEHSIGDHEKFAMKIVKLNGMAPQIALNPPAIGKPGTVWVNFMESLCLSYLTIDFL